MNEQLRAARRKKSWTIRKAADAARIGERTYRYWEQGTHVPTLSSLELLCRGFQMEASELGYGYLVSPPEVTQPITAELAAPGSDPGPLPAHSLTSLPPSEGEFSQSRWDGSFNASSEPIALDSTTWVVHILSMVTQWRRQAMFCVELQKLLAAEFSMFNDFQATPEAFEEIHLSRRQAFFVLAALPKGILTTSGTHQKTGHIQEEFLPQCTASITACWYLMGGREFAAVSHALSSYLPLLTTLAQQSSPYQKAAAYLVSQGYFLMGHLAMHQLRYRERVLYCKQAALYGSIAGDRQLQVSALATLADAYFQIGQPHSMLQTYQQAAQYLDEVPPLLKSKVLGGMAHAYAQQGSVQEVLRCLGEAEIIFEAGEGELPIFLSMDYGPFQAIQYEGQALLDLGDVVGSLDHYQQAEQAFRRIERLPSSLVVPERIRVEIVNQQTQVALKMGNLEQFRALLVAGAQGAKVLGSEKRRQEVITNWKSARKIWPHESLIMELADVLLE